MIQQNEVASKHLSIAWLLGASDGESGNYCLPELYFTSRMDKIIYSLGYELVAGVTLLSRQFTHSVQWRQS